MTLGKSSSADSAGPVPLEAAALAEEECYIQKDKSQNHEKSSRNSENETSTVKLQKSNDQTQSMLQPMHVKKTQYSNALT